uniref:Uncharacterized protein n=1 Tax=Physcomitrium patens TaxID=3218 RepID=A0A2K1KIX5_PHYPA|nr:hypothetical protein PHYPA_007390 [Physcomitrium patens]
MRNVCVVAVPLGAVLWILGIFDPTHSFGGTRCWRGWT